MNMYVLPAIGNVFKFCIVTTIFNIISVPYGSCLMHCFVAGSWICNLNNFKKIVFTLQNIQAYLETEFKMPPYGVFIAIACFTIIVGLLLGGVRIICMGCVIVFCLFVCFFSSPFFVGFCFFVFFFLLSFLDNNQSLLDNDQSSRCSLCGILSVHGDWSLSRNVSQYVMAAGSK